MLGLLALGRAQLTVLLAKVHTASEHTTKGNILAKHNCEQVVHGTAGIEYGCEKRGGGKARL